MSESVVRVALRSMGHSNEDHMPHGFRAVARTLLDESLRERIELIECSSRIASATRMAGPTVALKSGARRASRPIRKS